MKRRGITRWNLIPVRQEEYLLLKVEADADKAAWFGRRLPQKPRPPETSAAADGGTEGRYAAEREYQREQPECAPVSADRLKRKRARRAAEREYQREQPECAPVSADRLKRKRARRAEEREYQKKLQEYGQETRRLEEEIRQMAEEAEEMIRRADITGDVRCVYSRELSFLAVEDTVTGVLWNRFWDYSEFREYTAFRWMKPLLAEADKSGFFLLGTAAGLSLSVEHCARGIRELRWYLSPEDEVEEAEETAEEFCVEYGLTPMIRRLEGRHPFRTLTLASAEPVCVLDFTEEGKIFAGHLAPGSVWIDFFSVEEKEERIRRLSPGIRYVSLKKRWREAKPKYGSVPDLSGLTAASDRPGYNPGLRLERL